MDLNRFSRCFVSIFAFAATLLSVSTVNADGSGPLGPFPITGAYSATHIEDRDHISIIKIAGNYHEDCVSGLSTITFLSTKIRSMSTAKNINIQQLSQSERILLAEALWDSVVDNQDSLEVTESQQKILEQRLAAYHASPTEGTSWDEVKNEMK